ncbi:MAG: hypothetical protein KGY54_14645, partial [Oleiphilaceae bacterium]|nr:hypothetical protein [Oleiphilaceae bacterium]
HARPREHASGNCQGKSGIRKPHRSRNSGWRNSKPALSMSTLPSLSRTLRETVRSQELLFKRLE